MFFPRSCAGGRSTQEEVQDQEEKAIEETILIYFDFLNYFNLCLMLITSVAKYWVFIYEPRYDHNDLFFWISSLRTQSKNYINIWN